MKRKTFSDVRVGDGITSVPAGDGGNGFLWSGEVTGRDEREVNGKPYVCLTVLVHGRSLCADDLVYGFGVNRDGTHREVIYHLVHPVDEALLKRVRYKGRVVWAGYRAEAPVAA